jgi:FkbM family methyltransferase
MRLRRALRGVIRAPLRALGYDLVRAGVGPDPLDAIAHLLRGTGRPVIFDAGANVGQTAKALAGRFPLATIYSFEPVPDTFRGLARAAAGLPRVRPVQAALGAADGSLAMRVHGSSVENSPLPMLGHDPTDRRAGPVAVRAAPEVTVPVRRLDSFCAGEGIGRIDLLKLDVQGYELRVLEGCGGLLDGRRVRLVFAEVLFAEFYEGQAHADEVMGFLRRRGYKLAGLYDQDSYREAGLLQANALFVPATEPER